MINVLRLGLSIKATRYKFKVVSLLKASDSFKLLVLYYLYMRIISKQDVELIERTRKDKTNDTGKGDVVIHIVKHGRDD